MREDAARALAIVCAVVSGCALILQMVLLAHQFFIQNQGPLAAVWSFFGDFVLLSNLLAFIASTRAAIRPQDMHGMGSPAIHLTATSALIAGAVIYGVVFSEVIAAQGLQRMPEVLLYYIVPAVFTLLFLLRAQPGLRVQSAIKTLIWPALYCVYAMTRGSFDGWYAYWFLSISQLSLLDVLRNAAIFCAGFFLCALALLGARRVAG